MERIPSNTDLTPYQIVSEGGPDPTKIYTGNSFEELEGIASELIGNGDPSRGVIKIKVEEND